MGQVLETFVYQELRRQAGWFEELITFSHYRDKDKVEVDLVLESGTKTAGIEIKAGSTVRAEDFKGLRKLMEVPGNNFTAGVVLYDGDEIIRFGENLYAVPISCLWEYK